MSCMQSFSLVVNDVTLYVATLNLCFSPFVVDGVTYHSNCLYSCPK